MKRILISLLILALISGGVVYYQYSRTVPTLEEIEADYKMTADELYSAFETNEKEAMEKYEGKVIEISGKIEAIEKSEKDVNLTLTAEDAMLGGVNCSFKQLDKDLKEGESVILKGRCQGFLMNVVLNNCTLVYE